MWYNTIIKWLLKSPIHFFVSENMMLVTYRGRKSGAEYTTPVNYFPARDEGGEHYATTSVSERVWWRNLRGGAQVNVRIKGHDLPAYAQAFEDRPSVVEGMTQFLSETPGMAKYYQVELDQNGLPDSEQIATSAAGRVLVKTWLNGSR